MNTRPIRLSSRSQEIGKPTEVQSDRFTASGNTVSQLQQRWQKDTLELKPDLLSILVGVNDHGRGVPLEDLGRSSSLDKITHCSLDDFLFFGSG